MMSQWKSLATPLPIVMSEWVMEQKCNVHYLIPTKSSALNRTATRDVVMEIPFKTGHSMA